MIEYVTQIAPQRSTQYAELASTLSPFEVQLSPLQEHLLAVEPLQLGGQSYLHLQFSTELTPAQIAELDMLATTGGLFRFYPHLADLPGPLLHPIQPQFTPAFSPDLVATRRYKGKTNELFTHFMCNIARHSSDFSHRAWSTLRVFDPLAGGGTTLFTALMLGADAAGVEQNAQSAQTTAAFLKQYTQTQGIKCKVDEGRVKKLGKRWRFDFSATTQQCVIANGDTAQAPALTSGFKKSHLIVTDLPYGIQHRGKLIALLSGALPVWANLLQPGGVLTFSWDATRFPRKEMIDVVHSNSPFIVFDEAPYNQLSHQVDRVIKKRDLIVARL